ncbi:GNAT family N-acetyltransferase [Ectopseudomonas alcaliphila]|uniref:Acetyltransferase n=1 Tax=Ectopseudomonas alcaliphila TaxID=101564 RepID=A0A1G6XU73_9GAMM|nr:GNAT family N-acetyltransferase [Pseudomonas alcaliphila]MDX5992380.1 GNAT family N-acetyltransferase [Pseudomonas alcaliphila]SDD81531.1 acetyltransferase [Pseudomonas alcaliphila]
MAVTLQRLDSGSFDDYREGLIVLLLDAVKDGASLGFLADLDERGAADYFTQVHAGMADGSLLLWVAHEQGHVLGSVQLSLCQKPNGLNRAEIQKLLVLSTARRRGIARLLMQAVEQEATTRKRGLLYLDTEAGSDAEQLYRHLDYQCIGGLPDYACGPDGIYRANAIYYKTLARPN